MHIICIFTYIQKKTTGYLGWSNLQSNPLKPNCTYTISISIYLHIYTYIYIYIHMCVCIYIYIGLTDKFGKFWF